MITTVLFDLDGTLLPMDNDEFTKYYFQLLCEKMVPKGYDPQELISAIWQGTAAMVKNDGSLSNETVFWNTFSDILGEKVREDYAVFDEFYRNEFARAQSVCGRNTHLIELVHDLKSQGKRVALATNPIFPEVATYSRIRWAGFEPEEFELITTYENIGYCKPNPEYYREISRKLGVAPEECLMVGNDAKEDMIAQTIGMKVYLLTDHIINKDMIDLSAYAKGDYSGILQFF